MPALEDKVVAITGASSGIGEATALLLALHGAKVVLGARRPDRLAALEAQITAAGSEAVRTDFIEAVSNPDTKAQPIQARDRFAISPEAIARIILFAIEQPAEVDVGEIVVRPTAQA